jgi:tetratricopeptide (TPR) repeat protein
MMIRIENHMPLAKKLLVFIFLSFTISLIYSNTFDASWHFDDKPTILENKGLHIKNLKPASLIQTMFTSPKHRGAIGTELYRPIPCLTFGLNWYIGKDQVLGYHLVNIFIHSLTAFFLFLTILNLVKTPNLQIRYHPKGFFIAFFSAALWAINPVQTQAVTYIVQRMALMAAMFYILGIYFYIKYRISHSPPNRVVFLFGCALSFLMALGSKENTVTLPFALLLIEVLCFQDLSSARTKRRVLLGAIGGAIFLCLIAIWFSLPNGASSYLKGYHYRPFTLSERFLTEFRVVLFYLSLIFYPVPNRLSVEHDVAVSNSLFGPWTTLPSVLLILILIGFGFFQIRKRPLIALAILFFFLTHMIESTVIPLELIFEHRNYLPTMFIFLPVAAGFRWLFDTYADKKPVFKTVLAGSVVSLMLLLASGTYIRNMAWATEQTLWQDAMIKAPGKARPLLNLAWDLAYGENEKLGLYDKALAFYRKALPLKQSLNLSPAIIYANMAGIYAKKQDYRSSVQFYEKSLRIDNRYTHARLNLLNVLILLGRWEEASKHADLLLAEKKDSAVYLNTKGHILLRHNKPAEALTYFKKARQMAPNSRRIQLNMGVALSLTGRYDQSDLLLQTVNQNNSKDFIALLCLIENSVRAGNTAEAEHYTNKLMQAFDAHIIKSNMDKLLSDNFQVPLRRDLIASEIEKRLNIR